MAVQQLENQESQQDIPTRQESRDWLNEHLAKTIKNHLLVRLGHEGMMLDKIAKQNKIVRDGVRAAQEGKLPVATEDEDMGISIGNEIHYHGTEQNTTTAPAQPAPQAAPATTQPSLLQKYGIPALAAAAGLGLGALGYAALKPDAQPSNTNTTVIKPGDTVDVQLKLPSPSRP